MPNQLPAPCIYELNTWTWLHDLSKTAGRAVTLADVPETVWDGLADSGAGAVWLMGVWRRSPVSVELALANRGLLAGWRKALPDLRRADVVGSPYSIRDYEVDPHLGGAAGLAAARTALARRGLRLILDFVPNHLAPDHPWASVHPEWFIQGSLEDLRRHPEAFLKRGGHIFARGRDPYFPPWSDVLQLNAFSTAQRQAATAELQRIAACCDGVRCDMAMLVMNDIFEQTWGERAGAAPSAEYWPEVVEAVRSVHPEFWFLAEVYWGREAALLAQGFDACYDKEWYDRVASGSAERIREHVLRCAAVQSRLVRFLENHDEPRAARVLPGGKGLAAAVLLTMGPGIRLLHDGQLEGRLIRAPVHLGRRPDETGDSSVCRHYSRLLELTADPIFRSGRGRLCECSGWSDNQSFQNLLAWSWEKGGRRLLVVVNYSDQAAQGRVQVDWADLAADHGNLTDRLNGGIYNVTRADLASRGVFVDLPPWGSHLLELTSANRE